MDSGSVSVQQEDYDGGEEDEHLDDEYDFGEEYIESDRPHDANAQRPFDADEKECAPATDPVVTAHGLDPEEARVLQLAAFLQFKSDRLQAPGLLNGLLAHRLLNGCMMCPPELASCRHRHRRFASCEAARKHLRLAHKEVLALLAMGQRVPLSLMPGHPLLRESPPHRALNDVYFGRDPHSDVPACAKTCSLHRRAHPSVGRVRNMRR